jgi:two-component system response regulator YesN
MIETSNMKVYEVANLVGYTDQHYFSLIFKKIVGVSPSEYKAIL